MSDDDFANVDAHYACTVIRELKTLYNITDYRDVLL